MDLFNDLDSRLNPKQIIQQDRERRHREDVSLSIKAAFRSGSVKYIKKKTGEKEWQPPKQQQQKSQQQPSPPLKQKLPKQQLQTFQISLQKLQKQQNPFQQLMEKLEIPKRLKLTKK